MNDQQYRQAMAAAFGVEELRSIRRLKNRAIRTLPGGNETLDAIERWNNIRNESARRGTSVVVADMAIDTLENIRTSMEVHVMAEAQKYHRNNQGNESQ